MIDSISGGAPAAVETPVSNPNWDDSFEITSTEPLPTPEEKPQSDDKPLPEAPKAEDEDDDADGGAEETAKKKPQKGFVKKLTRTEQERDDYKAQVEALRQKYEAAAPAAAQPADGKPDSEPKKPVIEDFDSFLDFTEALQKFNYDQAIKAVKDELKQEQTAAETRKAHAEFQAHIETRINSIEDEVKAKESENPGLMQRLDKAAEEGWFTEPVSFMLTQIGNSADVAEYLVDNPEELQGLSQLSGPELERKMLRLEGYVEARKSNPQPAKRLSRAADPITPVVSTKTRNPAPEVFDNFEDFERQLRS